MEENDPTHVVFDWKKIIISENLIPLFQFIIGIENEIKLLLWINKKKGEIKEWYSELVELLKITIKEHNDVAWNLKFNLDQNKIIELFNFEEFLRVEFISMFWYLETLMYIYTSYLEEISDENEIIKYVNSNRKYVEKFYNDFLLNKKNKYFNKNKSYLSRLSAKELRNLRNNLTHFFSLWSNISLIQESVKEKARKIEQQLDKVEWKNIVFITSYDFIKLLWSATLKIILLFNNDSKNNPDEFKRKIKFVQDIINKKAPVLIKNWDINI